MVDKFDKAPEQPDRTDEENAADSLSRDAWGAEVRPFKVLLTEAAPFVVESLWRHQVKPTVAKLFSQVESRIAARRASTDAFSRLSQDDPAMDDAYAHLV